MFDGGHKLWSPSPLYFLCTVTSCLPVNKKCCHLNVDQSEINSSSLKSTLFPHLRLGLLVGDCPSSFPNIFYTNFAVSWPTWHNNWYNLCVLSSMNKVIKYSKHSSCTWARVSGMCYGFNLDTAKPHWEMGRCYFYSKLNNDASLFNCH